MGSWGGLLLFMNVRKSSLKSSDGLLSGARTYSLPITSSLNSMTNNNITLQLTNQLTNHLILKVTSTQLVEMLVTTNKNPSHESTDPDDRPDFINVCLFWVQTIFNYTVYYGKRLNKRNVSIVDFQSREQLPCFSTDAKQKGCIWIEINSLGITLGHQQYTQQCENQGYMICLLN